MDTFGVMLAGSVEAEVQQLRAILNVGTVTLPPLELGLLWGCAAHVLDFDLSSDTFNGHPTVHLLPATLAATRYVAASGADFVAAYTAGFETQSRIARGVNPQHVKKGWFPSLSIGVFGAAAAASHILHLTVEQTEAALNLAANMAAGSMAHAGTIGKPLAAGISARSGLLAALMAREGLNGASDAFEDRRGYLALFNGSDNYSRQAIIDSWGAPFDVESIANGFKQYPCCGVFHAALDVTRDLLGERAASDITSIDVRLTTSRLSHVNRPAPASELDAKFSAQFCVASLAVHRNLDLESFGDKRLADARTRELMERVTLGVDPDMPPDLSREEEGGAIVSITLRSGAVLGGRARYRVGREPGHPPSEQRLRDKFVACARRTITEPQALRLADALMGIERHETLQPLSDYVD